MNNRLSRQIFRFGRLLRRNDFGIKSRTSVKNTVNIEYYPLLNIGDTLGPVIVDWMLLQNNKPIVKDKQISETKHLITVGSIVNQGSFDTTVWGSGILNSNEAQSIKKKKILLHRKLDVRAVRGPITRDILLASGYICPPVYGDPAVLMPLVYPVETKKKVHDISLIMHYRTSIEHSNSFQSGNHLFRIDPELKQRINIIDPKTRDYRSFIEEITSSKLIVSSSLHGIILAEAYGIPSVFLNFGIEDQLTKFADWYESTGRELSFCTNLYEAVLRGPSTVPDFSKMRSDLIGCFPYDLWDT